MLKNKGFWVLVYPGKKLQVVNRVVNLGMACFGWKFRLSRMLVPCYLVHMKRVLFLLVGLSLVTFGAESLPPNAEALKARRDSKIAEINRVYAAELEKLKKLALADGNLSGATVIQKEIEAVSPNPFKEESTSAASVPAEDQRMLPLVGVWKRDTDSGVWNIPDTKGGVFNGRFPFTMTYDAENNRVAVVGTNWADHLTFTNNPDVISGITKVNGKTERYKLRRIK